MTGASFLIAENVAGLSFSLPQGKLVALLGRNGAGKTTLLRRLLGDFEKPTGIVRLGNEMKELREISSAQMAHLVAFVPQEHIYPGDLKLADLLRLAYLPRMGWWGKLPPGADEEIKSSLSRFRLSALAERRLRQLSTGERQRAFLARAILQRTEILFLDEPTNHLDPAGAAEFWQILEAERNGRHLHGVISTHDLAFVRKYCDWIVGLDSGKLIFDGSAEKFWRDGHLERIYGTLPFPV